MVLAKLWQKENGIAGAFTVHRVSYSALSIDMTDENPVKGNYDKNAEAYDQFITTPLGKLERQLFDLAIKECDGLRVLDLGGGTGLRARDALNAGADTVDVVDISHAMMHLGQEYEKSIGRDRIIWYYGDVSKSLDHLSLGPYDMVIANGIFDHAHNLEELEMMWHNAAAYLKPGGRLVANRNDPRSKSALDGKYGVVFTDFQNIPRGLSFRYRTMTDPPLEFESIGLEAYYSGSLEIPGKFFTDFRNVPWQETPSVKANPEFWKSYLDEPILYIFTARKLD